MRQDKIAVLWLTDMGKASANYYSPVKLASFKRGKTMISINDAGEVTG